MLALPALQHAAGAEMAAGRRLCVQVVAGLVPVLELAGVDADVIPMRHRRAILSEARRLRSVGARRGVLLTPSASSAVIFRAAGLRERRGTAGGWRTRLLTDPVDRKPLLAGHRVSEFLFLLGGEVEADPPAPRLAPPAQSGDGPDAWVRGDGPVVALFPGANGESRRWPTSRFAELAARLAARDREVLVLGGPGEEVLTGEVAGSGAVKGSCTDLGGRTDLRQLAAVLSKCDVLVTNDTGPMHLAAALGRPLVALEGPADVSQTRPLGSRVRLVGRFDLPCVPCVKNSCPRSGRGTVLPDADRECMRLITVDEVERAVEELLHEDGQRD